VARARPSRVCRAGLGAPPTRCLIYTSPHGLPEERFEESGKLDCRVSIRGMGRFRCNVSTIAARPAPCDRLIPEKIRGFPRHLGFALGNWRRWPTAARPGARHRPDRQRKSRPRCRDLSTRNQLRTPRAHPHHQDPIEFLHQHKDVSQSTRIPQDTESSSTRCSPPPRRSGKIGLDRRMRTLGRFEAALKIAEQPGICPFGHLHTNASRRRSTHHRTSFRRASISQIHPAVRCCSRARRQALLPRPPDRAAFLAGNHVSDLPPSGT